MEPKSSKNIIAAKNLTRLYTLGGREVIGINKINLRIVAGEWAGFNEAWLVERVIAVKSGSIKAFSDYGLLSVDQVISIIEKEWGKVCAYLPADYTRIKRPSYSEINPVSKQVISLSRLFKK